MNATADDLPALNRVLTLTKEVTARVRSEQLDMVEYGLALAMAASSIERSLKRFSDVDAASYARYTHLGQILRQFLEELDK